MDELKKQLLYASLDLAMSTRTVIDITKLHKPDDPYIQEQEEIYKRSLHEAVDIIAEAL